METPDIIRWGALALAALASVIQISPIKIDPWTALFKWIGRAINGELIEKVDKLEIQVDSIKQDMEESEIKSARVRILRFGDELYQGKKHSKEHFENILADISDYDNYCKSHPNFKNERTKVTEKIILDQYHECMIEHSFLE